MAKFKGPVTVSILMASSILATGMACAPAHAEDAGAGVSNVDQLQEEITVTARRREERLQDTPISVSAFSGESLEIRGITDVGELESVTPNLTYQNNPGAGGASQVASVYIRGVGQRDFLATIDNGVGFYIDDVYISRTVGGMVDLLDLERVEVLRGPQGTLFGRNNVGGAIKLHSRRPGDIVAGYVDVSYGTDNLRTVKGKVDLPLSDRFLTSWTGLYQAQDGYVDRPAGGDLGDENTLAGRFAALWTPTSDLEIDFSADISTSNDNGPAFVLIDPGVLAPGGFAGFHNNVLFPGACAYPGGITSTDPTCYNTQYVSRDENLGTAPAYSDILSYGTRLGVTWHIAEGLSLESITSIRTLDATFARDSDASPLTITHFYDDMSSQTFSQELQLSGETWASRLNWIIGAYYFSEDGYNLNRLQFAIAQFDSTNNLTTHSSAVFGQATLQITEALSVTAGLRYTEEKKTFDPVQITGPNNIGIPVGTLILPLGKQTRNDSATTPLINIAYNFTDDLMAYASYSEGFRSGGFVQRIFPPLSHVPAFGPEHAQSTEIGLKYRNDQLTLNAAVYQVEYTDIQVRAQSPGYVGYFESNIGDAEINGFELEAKWSPFDTWYFEGSVGQTAAEYTQIRIAPPLLAVVTTDSEFDHVPEWSAAASILKEFDLGAMGDLTARVSADYHSEYYNNPENTPNVITPDVTLYSMVFGWTPRGDSGLSARFGVKNITDERHLTAGYETTTIGTAEGIFDRGREFYISLRQEF